MRGDGDYFQRKKWETKAKAVSRARFGGGGGGRGSLGSEEPPQIKERSTKRSTRMYKKVHYTPSV